MSVPAATHLATVRLVAKSTTARSTIAKTAVTTTKGRCCGGIRGRLSETTPRTPSIGDLLDSPVDSSKPLCLLVIPKVPPTRLWVRLAPGPCDNSHTVPGDEAPPTGARPLPLITPLWVCCHRR